MNNITININRLDHVLRLYGLSKDEVLEEINKGVKRKVSIQDVFNENIKLSLLKKLDKIFERGLSYYIDPKNLEDNKEESIFFRKDSFNAELNFGAKKIVSHFEEEKISLSSLAKLSNLKISRILKKYNVNDNPKIAAKQVREDLYPSFTSDRKDFLKLLIEKFAEKNILVVEFVETWNKKNKANVNGFFLAPNFIVLKRNQNALRREIFTLVHELGHYLLNEEEIDERTEEAIKDFNSLSVIERWCSDFAYYFLIGELERNIDDLPQLEGRNNYCREIINDIAEKTNLSPIALYTRLLIYRKISYANYELVKKAILEDIRKWQEDLRIKREIEREKAKAAGKELRGSAPKPIISPLFVKTLQSAFNDGVISEMEFCKKLNIKPDKIERYLI